jgi:hypothetical protein
LQFDKFFYSLGVSKNFEQKATEGTKGIVAALKPKARRGGERPICNRPLNKAVFQNRTNSIVMAVSQSKDHSPLLERDSPFSSVPSVSSLHGEPTACSNLC